MMRGWPALGTVASPGTLSGPADTPQGRLYLEGWVGKAETSRLSRPNPQRYVLDLRGLMQNQSTPVSKGQASEAKGGAAHISKPFCLLTLGSQQG